MCCHCTRAYPGSSSRRYSCRARAQRIVLSTNVAETSVTVPGIRSVIDSGLARVSRYSTRSRLQRLPIEAISIASAEQRKGRCGRLGTGLCLRLYSQEEFEARAPFTEPEILRTNLAALLLRLAADRLGAAEDFPFIDAPDSRSLSDGYRLLQELQALDGERRITSLGRSMARLPLDPRLARALLESKRFRAESEILAIVAGLSVADVRAAVPRGAAPAASQEDAETTALLDHRSEFSAMVKMWRAYRAVREGPRSALRAWCKERKFSLLRFSEWEDVHAQVAERARELGIVARGFTASYTGIHRALLAGFFSLVGVRGEEGVYQGTRGAQFYLFPGSPLARRKPRWLMAANIVETSRVFARRVAQIEPNWIEAAGAHLLKREYLSPDWDEGREEVVARERVSLLGLILSANRIVNYGPIAPGDSRRIFAREALVYGRLTRRPPWLQENDAALLAAQRVEERLRTRGLLQNAESLAEFYDRALPRQVSSGATLEYFSRHLTQEQQTALTLTADEMFARHPDAEALMQFPETVQMAGMSIGVQYRFRARGARRWRHVSRALDRPAAAQQRRGEVRDPRLRCATHRGTAALTAKGCTSQPHSHIGHGARIRVGHAASAGRCAATGRMADRNARRAANAAAFSIRCGSRISDSAGRRARWCARACPRRRFARIARGLRCGGAGADHGHCARSLRCEHLAQLRSRGTAHHRLRAGGVPDK